MTNLAAPLMGALVCAVAAPAFAQTPELVAKYDEAVIRRIANSLEMEVILTLGMEDDLPRVEVETLDGLRMAASGQNCVGEGAAKACTGLMLSAFYTLASNEAAEAAAKQINSDYLALKVWAEEKNLFIVRYLILDHGVTLANLETEMAVFEEAGVLVWEAVVE